MPLTRSPSFFPRASEQSSSLLLLLLHAHVPTGLYKQLASLKELLTDQREEARTSAPASTATSPAEAQHHQQGAGGDMRASIFGNVQLAGLQDDMPFFPAPDSALWALAKQQQQQQHAGPAPGAKAKGPAAATPSGSSSASSSAALLFGGGKGGKGAAAVAGAGQPGGKVSGPPEGSLPLTQELVDAMSEEEWARYCADLYTYLQVRGGAGEGALNDCWRAQLRRRSCSAVLRSNAVHFCGGVLLWRRCWRTGCSARACTCWGRRPPGACALGAVVGARACGCPTLAASQRAERACHRSAPLSPVQVGHGVVPVGLL